MQNPRGDKRLTPDQQNIVEGELTFSRIVELELNPVRGNFDEQHLKEINRRIFQDFPGAGLVEIRYGEFRKPVGQGLDWLKQRHLSTIGGPFYVAYSLMDDAAILRLKKILGSAKPEKLRRLNRKEFSAWLAEMYAEADYIHPFLDGNSRTLRTFTRQIARESGYELDWEKFNRTEADRDLLYIARDRKVNELAKSFIQHENAMRKILFRQDQLNGYRSLHDLLDEALRPMSV